MQRRSQPWKLCPAHHAAQVSRTAASGMETGELPGFGFGGNTEMAICFGRGFLDRDKWWMLSKKAENMSRGVDVACVARHERE